MSKRTHTTRGNPSIGFGDPEKKYHEYYSVCIDTILVQILIQNPVPL